MASKGRKLRQLVLPLSVRVAGIPVNFEYRIGGIDAGWERRMNEAQGLGGSFEQIIEVMLEVVTKWNWDEDYVKVTDDAELARLEEQAVPVVDGYRLATEEESDVAIETRVVPLTKEAILQAEIPPAVFGQILQRLQEDASQGGAQAKKS